MSDYTVELRFIRDELLDVGIARNHKEAEEMAKDWLTNIEDPLE